MILAEGPSFGPEIILLMLIPVLIGFFVLVGIAVLGCFFAKRAGRGLIGSMIGWFVIAALEFLALAGSLGLGADGMGVVGTGMRITGFLPAIALVTQMAFFVSGRKKGPVDDENP